MPIQANSAPYRMEVVVATTTSSHSTAKQPAGFISMARLQSLGVWPQPTAWLNSKAGGTSEGASSRIRCDMIYYGTQMTLSTPTDADRAALADVRELLVI